MKLKVEIKLVIKALIAASMLTPLGLASSSFASQNTQSMPLVRLKPAIMAISSFDVATPYAKKKKKKKKNAVKQGKNIFNANCLICHNNTIAPDLAGAYTADQIYTSYSETPEMQILTPITQAQINKVIAYLATK